VYFHALSLLLLPLADPIKSLLTDLLISIAGIAASSTLIDVDSSDDEPLIEIAVKGRGTPGGGSDERSPPQPKSRPNSRSRDEEFTK